MKLRHQTFYPCVLVVGSLLLSLAWCGRGYGQETTAVVEEQAYDTVAQEKFTFFKGDIIDLKVYGLTRIAIVDQGVFDIVSAEIDHLLIIGRNEGETAVFIWDSKGKRRIQVQVILQDPAYIMRRMEKLFQLAKIEGIVLEQSDLEGKIIASGKIQKEKKEAFLKILEKFNAQVINMVTDDAQLIEIDVQITELSQSLTKTLGVTWPTSIGYSETLPTWQGDLGDLFKIGDFTRTAALTATVNLLLSEGKGRILSKPNVVVTNGEAATFLVGGEIPITTTTTDLGNLTQNVSYKSYGIDLTVTPTIKEDKIDTTLSVAIRDVDGAIQGNSTAFTTRSADTKLLLKNGQTIVLAGLIKQNRSQNVSQVPFLGKIPVVGMLFRSKTAPTSDVEVVIIMTPHILKDDDYREDRKKRVLSELNKKVDRASKDQAEAEGDVSFNQTDEDVKGEEKETLTVPVNVETVAVSAANDEGEAKTAEEQVSAPGPLPKVENISPVLTNYVQSVQKKIAQAISFPYEAKAKGLEGTATLKLEILSDGKLNKAVLQQTSGQEIFDKDALNTAQVVAPFAPFPAEIDLEELEITIPVVYSPKTVLEGEQK